MGAPNDYLVPPAILYNHPQGLTEKEFIFELSKIGGRKMKYKLDHASLFQNGLYSLAFALNLPITKEYERLSKSNWDNDFKYYKQKEFLLHRGYLCQKETAQIIRNEHNIIGEFEIETSLNNEFFINKYEEKGYVDSYWLNIQDKFKRPNIVLQVLEVLETKIDRVEEGGSETNQKLRVRALKFKTEIEKFKSIKDLIKKYPEYSPKNIYDFSQETGFLFPNKWFPGKLESFKWSKFQGKYFLDLKNMYENISPNSIYPSNRDWVHKLQDNNSEKFSLTDLVLTAEAINHKRWDCIKYIGFRKNFERFIYSSPEILRKYDLAVITTELSQLAKKESWSNLEYLREFSLFLSSYNLDFERRKREWIRDKIKKGISRKKQLLLKEKESLSQNIELLF